MAAWVVNISASRRIFNSILRSVNSEELAICVLYGEAHVVSDKVTKTND